ncbi:ABC transporter substrate-binding protein [Microbacterium suwonense]|uniref:ABC transporter substrate-binding protein n=1 Tax=Microbacterium suwonense TaxID=683047 RepID=UPI0036075E37
MIGFPAPHKNRVSRRVTRGAVLAVSAALTMTLALAGCSPKNSGDSSDGSSGDAGATLSFGLSSEPAGFKTGVDQGSAAREIITLVRRGLLTYDGEGKVVPALASDYTVSDDGLTYTFTLRSGLKFSNGDSLTSADVKRTFEYLAVDENGAAAAAAFANIATIDTPDDATVVLTLSQPQTAFPQVLADPLSAIVPEDAVDADGVPIGDGPFKIVDYRKGVSYTLEANPDYFDADSVKLGGIDVTFMADAQTRVKALMSGQVQFIDYVAAADFKTLESAKGITLKTAPGLYGAVQFNLTRGALAVPEVRQAIAYAIDLKAYSQAGTLGYGEPTGGLPIAPTSPYYDKEQAGHFALNVDKAKQLLAEAGYAEGVKLTLLTNSQYFGYSERAQVVKSDLEAIGITVDIESGDYANQIAKGNSGDYDLMIGGPSAALNDPSAITAAFIGGPTFVRSVGIDQSLYADLLEEGAKTADGPEREAIYKEIGEIYLKDVPFVTTGTGVSAYAYTDKLKGFQMLSGAIVYSSLYNLATAELSE